MGSNITVRQLSALCTRSRCRRTTATNTFGTVCRMIEWVCCGCCWLDGLDGIDGISGIDALGGFGGV